MSSAGCSAAGRIIARTFRVKMGAQPSLVLLGFLQAPARICREPRDSRGWWTLAVNETRVPEYGFAGNGPVVDPVTGQDAPLHNL